MPGESVEAARSRFRAQVSLADRTFAISRRGAARAIVKARHRKVWSSGLTYLFGTVLLVSLALVCYVVDGENLAGLSIALHLAAFLSAGAAVWMFFVKHVADVAPAATQSGLGKQPADYRGSWREVEDACVEWMRLNGAHDVAGTRHHKDHGIDAVSTKYVAQTKAWVSNVGAPAVRELHGVATSMGKQGIVFSTSGYTADALEFAADAGVALFTFNGEQVQSHSPRAHELYAKGL